MSKQNIVINRKHPLKDKPCVSLGDIAPYPFLTYEYEKDHSQTMMEGTIFNGRPQKMLRVQDRSTLNWLIRNTNGFSIGHGLMDEDFHKDLIHVPLGFESSFVTVGWLCRTYRTQSDLARQFVALLQEEVNARLQQLHELIPLIF